MKTENEIKLLNEVIEILKVLKTNKTGVEKYLYYDEGLESAIDLTQSLLPKEEAKDWSKASDEELKKEAEKLIGKTIVCLVDNKPHVVKQHYNNDPNNTHSDGSIWMDSETLIGSTNEQMGIQVYCRESNQWAEIIPDRQIKEPVIHEVKSEPTQEIKVGDEVEYFDNHTQEWQSPNKPVIFTGGRARNGNYVLQDCHGFFSMDQIRKPLQKTQEEMDREKVEEILHEMDTTHHSCRKDLIIQAINYGRNTKQN